MISNESFDYPDQVILHVQSCMSITYLQSITLTASLFGGRAQTISTHSDDITAIRGSLPDHHHAEHGRTKPIPAEKWAYRIELDP